MNEEERDLFYLPKGEFGNKKKAIFKNHEEPSETKELFTHEAMVLAFYDHNPKPKENQISTK